MKWKEQGIYNYAGIKPEGQGGGGELGPNTVGTEEIIDKSVMINDLNQEVTDKLKSDYDSSNETLYLNGSKPNAQ